MPEWTEYFEEPLVRIDIDKARFPHICPVCGGSAKRRSRIMVAPREGPVRTYKGARLSGPGTRSMLVYVCDEHYQPDDERERGKCLCAATTGILISLLLVEVIFASGDLSLGRPVSIGLPLVIVLLGVSMILAILIFRPSELEMYVKIIGFDLGITCVWLRLRNPEYRDVFMEENLMHAELVNWIRRGI